MNRVIVCTASIGGHDPLMEPGYVANGVRYLCAADRNLPTDSVWERREPLRAPGPDVMSARRTKLLAHEWVGPADLIVWIDSRFSLQVDPHVFIQPLLRRDVLVMPHPWCDSIAKEAREISNRGLVSQDILDRQVEAYCAAYRKGKAREPRHASTGLLVRRNSLRVRRFCRYWWEEMGCYGHSRDQMSFGYAAWRHGIEVGFLEGGYRDNPYADWEAA